MVPDHDRMDPEAAPRDWGGASGESGAIKEEYARANAHDLDHDPDRRKPGRGSRLGTGHGPDPACLEFRKYKVDNDGKLLQPLQLESEPNERIVCTGKDVLQYQWDVKEIYVFPLEKEVRQKALQQGPLPFLFNMRAADARKR